METKDFGGYYEGYDEYCGIENEYQNKIESKLLLYENFKKIIMEIIEESENGIVKTDELKIQINDLEAELRSV